MSFKALHYGTPTNSFTFISKFLCLLPISQLVQLLQVFSVHHTPPSPRPSHKTVPGFGTLFPHCALFHLQNPTNT